MKKYVSAILVIILCVIMITGCGNTTYNTYNKPLTAVKINLNDNSTSPVSLDEDAQTQILSMLNNGTWTENASNCGYDFAFHANGKEIKYHSCGTFYDVESKHWMSLTDEQTDFVNQALGADKENTH